jgi:hypothetical protein
MKAQLLFALIDLLLIVSYAVAYIIIKMRRFFTFRK